MKSNKVGYIYVFLASFFFALIAVIGKTVFNSGISAFDLLVLQYAASILFLAVYFAATDIKRLIISRQRLKDVLIQGFIGSAPTTILFYMALEVMNAGIASMLLFIHPVLVSIYFIATKSKKITLTNNLALISAVLGSIMVINVSNADTQSIPIMGIVFGIAASAAYAFFNINADIKLKGMDSMVVPFYTSLASLIAVIIINPGFFRFDFEFTPNLLIYACELGVISGILPVVFLYKGISLLGADKASIVATTELPITIILSYFVLGEKMELVQLFGIVMIMFSIIILQKEESFENYINKVKSKG
jgi:drug/metabolite transporter (DMT)-like permease